MYRKFLKRSIDLVVSIGLLALLSPLFVVISLVIVFTSKGPLFFIQTRVGRDVRIFRLLKFRTMTNCKHKVKKIHGKTEEETEIGYYLRRIKVDELPQLINVMKGEMSLVGPRPSVPEQLSEMTQEEKRRYRVRPGMTGLAQVCGNIHISWKERFQYDLQSINNVSFVNDLKIILRTFLIIFIGEEKFKNNPLRLNETT